jgi:multidrug efflux pump subunit AcrA (membrane-fusion protein)
VTIYLESRKDVLTVPSRAITREKGERFVTVVDGDARINKKIKTGWFDNSYTEVTEGLEVGEIVLLPE